MVQGAKEAVMSYIKAMGDRDYAAARNYLGEDPNAAVGALVVALPMLAIEHGIGGLLKGSTASDHFLTIHWKDASGISSAVFRSDEQTIRELCAELDKFSKRSAVDLDAATEKVRTEFNEQMQTTNYYIDIEQIVHGGQGCTATGQVSRHHHATGEQFGGSVLS